jgi:hypothetical protein
MEIPTAELETLKLQIENTLKKKKIKFDYRFSRHYSTLEEVQRKIPYHIETCERHLKTLLKLLILVEEIGERLTPKKEGEDEEENQEEEDENEDEESEEETEKQLEGMERIIDIVGRGFLWIGGYISRTWEAYLRLSRKLRVLWNTFWRRFKVKLTARQYPKEAFKGITSEMYEEGRELMQRLGKTKLETLLEDLSTLQEQGKKIHEDYNQLIIEQTALSMIKPIKGSISEVMTALIAIKEKRHVALEAYQKRIQSLEETYKQFQTMLGELEEIQNTFMDLTYDSFLANMEISLRMFKQAIAGFHTSQEGFLEQRRRYAQKKLDTIYALN